VFSNSAPYPCCYRLSFDEWKGCVCVCVCVCTCVCVCGGRDSEIRLVSVFFLSELGVS
jgi:hypothetical protein